MKQDPLHDLRRAWNNEASPVPGEELQTVDAETREKVQRLQSIWRDQSAAAPIDLSLLQRRLTHAQTPHRRPLIVATMLLAAAALVVLVTRPPSKPNVEPELRSASITTTPQGSDGHESHANRQVRSPAKALTPAVRHLEQNQVVFRKDGIELVSGNVRLVLVQSTTTQTH